VRPSGPAISPVSRDSTQMKKLLVLAPVASFAAASHAALDSAVTTAITTAQTDLLALLAALTTAGVAIWVGRLIYRKFTVK
jgi:hypothetical protein